MKKQQQIIPCVMEFEHATDKINNDNNIFQMIYLFV